MSPYIHVHCNDCEGDPWGCFGGGIGYVWGVGDDEYEVTDEAPGTHFTTYSLADAALDNYLDWPSPWREEIVE